jgi:hypothetical protein
MKLDEISGVEIVRTVWSPAAVYIRYPNGDVWEYLVYDNATLRRILRGRRNMGRVISQLKQYDATKMDSWH